MIAIPKYKGAGFGFCPVGESSMKRYNPSDLYVRGGLLYCAIRIEAGSTRQDNLEVYTKMLNSLGGLSEHNHFDMGSGVTDSAIAVRNAVVAMFQNGVLPDGTHPLWNVPIRPDEIAPIQTAIKEFETRFYGKCLELQLYSIDQIAAYDTKTLIENGENLIPEELRYLLPEIVQYDIKAGARCIAFDLPTAAAFHIGRAFEGVVRLYFETCIDTLPKRKHLGSLVNSMVEKNKTGLLPHPNELTRIQQITQEFRNPVSHPDLVVSIPMAQMMLGVYIAGMVALLIHVDAELQP